MTATAPAAAKTDRKLTSYRVLKFPGKTTTVAEQSGTTTTSGSPTPPGLTDVGTQDAANAKAAVRAASDKHGAGTYVAVPASSWKPQKVTVEQTTVTTVGDA